MEKASQAVALAKQFRNEMCHCQGSEVLLSAAPHFHTQHVYHQTPEPWQWYFIIQVSQQVFCLHNDKGLS